MQPGFRLAPYWSVLGPFAGPLRKNQKDMNKASISKFSGALMCAIALSASPMAFGQTTVSTTTTAGTISEFTPGSQIVVRTESAPEPITYSVGKTVTYVDETGAPVSADLVKSGLPVTVYYAKEGDRMVANKVVVRKTTTTTTAPAAVEKRTTTTTTTKSGEKDDD